MSYKDEYKLTPIKKDFNREIFESLNNEETKKILFELGIPNLPIFSLMFDKILFKESNYIIIGQNGVHKISIDLDKDESIYLVAPEYKDLLNSSLSQMIQFIEIYYEYIDKLYESWVTGNRKKILFELEKKLTEIDKDAYFSDENLWYRHYEDFEIGI